MASSDSNLYIHLANIVLLPRVFQTQPGTRTTAVNNIILASTKHTEWVGRQYLNKWFDYWVVSIKNEEQKWCYEITVEGAITMPGNETGDQGSPHRESDILMMS